MINLLLSLVRCLALLVGTRLMVFAFQDQELEAEYRRQSKLMDLARG